MARPRRVSGESPLFWIGSSKSDLLALPEAVKDDIGTALSVAQFGGKHPMLSPGGAKDREPLRSSRTIEVARTGRFTP
jgi:phage-related protein